LVLEEDHELVKTSKQDLAFVSSIFIDELGLKVFLDLLRYFFIDLLKTFDDKILEIIVLFEFLLDIII
jgi:hypothetical protein